MAWSPIISSNDGEYIESVWEEIARRGIPSPTKTKDGGRGTVITGALVKRYGWAFRLSHNENGDDARLESEFEFVPPMPVELKTTNNPASGDFDFHKLSENVVRRLLGSLLLFGVFRVDELGIERLAEVWYLEPDSEFHKTLECSLADLRNGSKKKRKTLRVSRMREMATRLM